MKSGVLNKIAKVLFIAIFPAVAYFAINHVLENREILEVFYRIPLYYWLAPAVLYIITIYIKGLSFDVLALVFGAKVKFSETMALSSSSLLSNYALPGNSGIAFRTLYMQRVLKLSYKTFLPISLIAFLFSTGLYAVASGVAAFAHGGFEAQAQQYLIILFSLGGAAVLVGGLIALPLSETQLFSKFGIKNLVAGWSKLVRTPKLASAWLAIEGIRAALEIGIYYMIAVTFMQLPLSVAEVAVIVLTKECSMFLRITPGALGVSEGVQVFFAVAYGVSATNIVLVSLAYRVIEVVCLTIGTMIFLPGLKNKIFDQ